MKYAAIAVIAAVLVTLSAAGTAAHASTAQGGLSLRPTHDRIERVIGVPPQQSAVDRQDAVSDHDSSRIDVMLWTVLAAAGAGGLFLLFFLVRIAMGWVRTPPPQTDDAHH